MDRRHPHLAPFFTPHAGRRYAAPGGSRAAHRQSVQLPTAALSALGSGLLADPCDDDAAAEGPVRGVGSTKRAEHPVALDENADGSNAGAWAWDAADAAGSALASSSAFPSPPLALAGLVPGAPACGASASSSISRGDTDTEGSDDAEAAVVVAVGDPQLPLPLPPPPVLLRRAPSLHHSLRSSASASAGPGTVPTPKIPALDPDVMLTDDDDDDDDDDAEVEEASMVDASLGAGAGTGAGWEPVPVLPVVKRPGLFAVSVDTVARLLEGGIAAAAGWRVRIIDCRFPFEYAGGHIVGAENLTVPGVRAQLAATAFAPAAAAAARRTILLFHCEYSAVRGPATMEALRAMDRDRNGDRYPAVDYEQIYLIAGGYRAFHARHPHLCTGRAYVSMHDPRHSADATRLDALFRRECPDAKCSMLLRGDAARDATRDTQRPGLARSATFHALHHRSESAQPAPTTPVHALPRPDAGAMVRSGSARLVSRFSLDDSADDAPADDDPLDGLDIDLSSPIRPAPPRRLAPASPRSSSSHGPRGSVPSDSDSCMS